LRLPPTARVRAGAAEPQRIRGCDPEERNFDWSSLIELLTWVAAQPREIPGGRGDDYADLDPGWVWTRREIAGLLERGLNDRGACAMPLDERERVWQVITGVTDDPDPTPEHEERYCGQNMDPTTLSLNTARPRGLRAAIAYAIWVYHHLVGDELSSEGFVEAIPEVKELLEAHLDPERDPSTAVRAVFGQHYVNLFVLDNDWAAEMGRRSSRQKTHRSGKQVGAPTSSTRRRTTTSSTRCAAFTCEPPSSQRPRVMAFVG